MIPKFSSLTNFRLIYEVVASCSEHKANEVEVSSSIKALEANNFHSILGLLTAYYTLVNTETAIYKSNALASYEQYVWPRVQREMEINHQLHETQKRGNSSYRGHKEIK